MIRYKIFLRIVENGNFTKTAAEFGYTQSAVSQMVRSLEEELKITLFTRTKHGIYLTSDGNAIVPHIKKLVNDYEGMLSQTFAIKRLEGSTIRIGAFASVSANFLPGIIKKFKEIYPAVHFKLLQSDYETIQTWIKNGAVDFGFLTIDLVRKLKYIHILDDEMVMIMPKGHRCAEKEHISMKDFADDPFIFLDQGKKSEPLEYFKKSGVEPNLQYQVYDDYTIMNMVEQGLGISILPKLVLLRHHQDIVVRSLTPALHRDICVAYKNDESISIAGKLFVDFITENTKNAGENI